MKKQTRKKPAPSPTLTAEHLDVGETIVVTIKRIGINGEGVGYYRRKAVFIKGVLPDEVVKAKVTRIEPGFIHAEAIVIEKRSPLRQKPQCPVYDRCGGCQLQHLKYEGQLKAKEEIVREAFKRYAGLDQVNLKPMLGMDQPWGYRNKAQVQLGFEHNKLIVGLYEPGTHRLVDIAGCPIHHPKVNKAIDIVKSVLASLNVSIYKDRSGSGVVRNIVVRAGLQSDELQITIVTATERLPQRETIVAAIRRAIPEVTTIAQNVNAGKTSLIFGDRTKILWGKDTIEESLGDLPFSLSPRAFFQLNPEQTVKLYDTVREAAALTGRETVIDAYCGTGTIGLWLAPYAKEIRGIEVIPEAVEDARANAERSGRTNVSFYAGKVEDLLPRWIKQGISPDVVVVDPPRTGCDERLLRSLIQTKPKRIVYVSCNPSTLAKDCKQLLDNGYEIAWIQPVDMFPQTAHVECCVSLVRK